MRSTDHEVVQQMISDAMSGDPDEFTLELSASRFDALGTALDAATATLMSRGYHLTRVRAAGDNWVATYRRVAGED